MANSLTEFINNKCGNYGWALSSKLRESYETPPFYWEHAKQAYKVQQPYMYAAFILRKKQYQIVGKSTTTRKLYHVTNKSSIPSILRTNLDYRRCSRQRYGPGSCFVEAVKIDYALEHSSASRFSRASCDYVLIEADVLVSNKVVRSAYMNSGIISDDTGICSHGIVYVKGRDDEFYPSVIFQN